MLTLHRESHRLATGDTDSRLIWALAVPLAVSTIILALFAGMLASGATPVMALFAPVMIVPILIWTNPKIVLYVLFAASVCVEQNPYVVGPLNGAVTMQVPMFHPILGGINPTEVLLVAGLLVVLMQAVARRERWVHRSPVQIMCLTVIGFVLVYVVIGLSEGGDKRMALWEVRPFLYFFGTYLLAAAFIDRFEAAKPLLWIFVVGCSFKAAYGLLIFVRVRGYVPRPDAVLSHEESFFFGVYFIMTAAMWLFQYRDRLRTVATTLLPIVLLSNMANMRRTAWLIVIAGLGVLVIIAMVRLHDRRRAISGVIVVVALASTIYFPAYWDKGGALAQPASALRSSVDPRADDESSDLYREMENRDLEFHIRQSRSLGVGFGRPIAYSATVENLVLEVPMLAYVPHNGVLWLWLRMGYLGLCAFAVMVGQVIISGARLASDKRRDVAMVGALVASAAFGYVAMGATDIGFWWFRNAIAMGALVGMMDGLRRTTATGPQPDGEVAETVSHPDRALAPMEAGS